MNTEVIHLCPSKSAVIGLLQAAALPASDLTEAHMANFFYCGPATAPAGIVGLEFCGTDALLRSLAVAPERRGSGLGAALVDRAESHARQHGACSVFLLTTTAETFFLRRGYTNAARESAPPGIRATREFSDLCPASSAFMVKQL
jgi:amino-acid N-acetyltransferase